MKAARGARHSKSAERLRGPNLPVPRGFGQKQLAREAVSPAIAQRAARQGAQAPSEPLPFLREVQESFGRHDVSGTRAHFGSAASASARAMNALAFASGAHIVFSRPPDLWTTAHEAAHVVQQRSGAVRLSGGISTSRDRYEQQADAVASRVVAGSSAEPLLDAYETGQQPNAASGTTGGEPRPPGAPIQRIVQEREREGRREYFSSRNAEQGFSSPEEARHHEAVLTVQARVRGRQARKRLAATLYSRPEVLLPEALRATAPPGRPGSPVLASRLVRRIAELDPRSQVTPHLSQSQVPGLSGRPFTGEREGGGFIAEEVERRISKADLKRAQQGGPAPKPKEIKTGKSIEFHPGGGIHSGYQPSSDEAGGSYFRVGDYRIGRHGQFAPDQLFTGEPIRRTRPPAASSQAGSSAAAARPEPVEEKPEVKAVAVTREAPNEKEREEQKGL